jgi:hypothetical protein
VSRHRQGREPGDAIWVRSDRTHDDAYIATVEVGPDVSIPLSHHQALAYVMTVLGVVARAEYDAAVVAQMVAMGAGDDATASMVRQLRERYPALENVATAPLTFVPLVGRGDRKPYVHVALDGVTFCQWDSAAARQHAGYVLDVATVVDLDAAYLGYLTSVVQLKADVARATVDNLARHRPITTQEGARWRSTT